MLAWNEENNKEEKEEEKNHRVLLYFAEKELHVHVTQDLELGFYII